LRSEFGDDAGGGGGSVESIKEAVKKNASSLPPLDPRTASPRPKTLTPPPGLEDFVAAAGGANEAMKKEQKNEPSGGKEGNCVGVPKSRCVGPDCKWVKGVKRSFCRRKTNRHRSAKRISAKKAKVKAVKIKKFVRKTQKKSASPKPCKEKTQAQCVGPDCSWAKGAKLSFCRRSTNKKQK